MKCRFCLVEMPDELTCRTHALFTHNFLLPQCESKAYFAHIKKIDALRRQHKKIRREINERAYREYWYNYTKSMMNQYKGYFQQKTIDRKYENFYHASKEYHWKIQRKYFKRLSLFRHNMDMKNYAFVIEELDKEGILVDV